MKTNLFNKPCLLGLCMLMLSACKDTLMVFDDAAGLYIHKAVMLSQRDSITYSFSEQKAGLKEDTLFVPVKITGRLVNHDRTIPVELLVNETTAEDGKHFSILKSAIKANEYEGVIPIVIYKTTDLKTHIVQLRIQTVTNADFPLAITRTKTNNDFNGENWGLYEGSYLIKITDQVVKPDTWDASGSWFRYYFGAYSQVKYKFIMDVTGRTVWPPRARDSEEMTSVLMDTYYAQLIQALFLYEQEHGPMLDEHGNRVIFPSL